MVVFRTGNAVELRRDWNKLFDDLEERSLSPSRVESTCVGAKCDSRKAEISEVIRPSSPVLNLLLDAISFKFAELEKQRDSSESRTQPASASQSDRENPQEGCNDDSTDDEFFGSPSVMSYSRLRILDRPASSPMKLPSVPSSSLPNVSLKKDKAVVKLPPQKLFVSPKKEETKLKGKAYLDPLPLGSEEGFKKFASGVHKQKKSFPRHKQEVTVIENENYRAENNNKADENDFLDKTLVTLDATPPSKKHLPRPINVETSKDDLLDDSLVSLDATIPYVPKSSSSGSGNSNSFVITSKTKKQVWVDPDAESRSGSSTTSQGKKRFKQTSLLSCARNMPQKKTDMSSLTTYNKGNRSSSQSELFFTPGNKEPSPPTGTKRKSDESIEGDGKRDKSGSESLSQTFFDVSPMKHDRENADAPLTPPKKSNATKGKPRSPLSPGKLNILEEKPVTSRYNLHDSTYNLLKDFDKVPAFKTPPSKAEQSRNQANKMERAKKQNDPVCCCPPTDSERRDLEHLVDPSEFERKCPVHNGVALAKLIAEANSPKDYWCTPQYQTQELYERGHIRVASTPFTPPPRRPRRDSNGDTILFNEENDGDF